MYSEDDLIPISALQHAMFCERQVALIHIEQLWVENLYTAQGRALHERVDREHYESRRTTRTEYSMPVRSLKYGLVGVTDVVEFEKNTEGGYSIVRPVEYKRGKKKSSDVDNVQLCAQALCLEEMFLVAIGEGQFYYLQQHRRTTLQIDDELRVRTIELVRRVRQILSSQQPPQAVYKEQKCERCSLIEICMPKSCGTGGKNVARYIDDQLRIQNSASGG
jgi:CRISPR-associated exonuclease Cas4